MFVLFDSFIAKYPKYNSYRDMLSISSDLNKYLNMSLYNDVEINSQVILNAIQKNEYLFIGIPFNYHRASCTINVSATSLRNTRTFTFYNCGDGSRLHGEKENKCQTRLQFDNVPIINIVNFIYISCYYFKKSNVFSTNTLIAHESYYITTEYSTLFSILLGEIKDPTELCNHPLCTKSIPFPIQSTGDCSFKAFIMPIVIYYNIEISDFIRDYEKMRYDYICELLTNWSSSHGANIEIDEYTSHILFEKLKYCSLFGIDVSYGNQKIYELLTNNKYYHKDLSSYVSSRPNIKLQPKDPKNITSTLNIKNIHDLYETEKNKFYSCINCINIKEFSVYGNSDYFDDYDNSDKLDSIINCVYVVLDNFTNLLLEVYDLTKIITAFDEYTQIYTYIVFNNPPIYKNTIYRFGILVREYIIYICEYFNHMFFTVKNNERFTKFLIDVPNLYYISKLIIPFYHNVCYLFGFMSLYERY